MSCIVIKKSYLMYSYLKKYTLYYLSLSSYLLPIFLFNKIIRGKYIRTVT